MSKLDAIGDLLAEVDSKNHLTVVHYRGGRGEELESSGVSMPSMLFLADKARMLAGRKPVYLAEAFRRLGGDVVGVFPNLRTTVGIDYASVQLGGTASATTAKYIAVSNNTNAANAANTATNTTSTRICWGTDTATDAAASTTRGEYSALGMARALATYAHTGGVASYSQTVTFTATSACTSMQAAGLFDNATKQSGTLFVESVYTATTLANTDQLSIAWTINI